MENEDPEVTNSDQDAEDEQFEVDPGEETSEDTNVDADSDADSDDDGESEESEDEVAEEEEFEEEDPLEEDDFQYEVQGRVSFRELKEKYPDIFKKVPQLREVLGRERAYTEIFPTVDHARLAGQRNEKFEVIQESLQTGRSIDLIKSLASRGEEIFARYTDDFLPALKRVDSERYYNTVTPHLVSMLKQVQTTAKASGNKNLWLSVQHISNALFEKADLPDIKIPEPNIGAPREVNPQVAAIQAAREQDFKVELVNQTEVSTHRMVVTDADVKKIKDPTYRKYVSTQIMTEADQMMQRDPLYQKAVSSFKARIARGDYSSETKKQIELAYLRRVKSFIGPAKRKVLGGSKPQPRTTTQPAKYRPSGETQASASKRTPSNKPKPFATVKEMAEYLRS